MARPFEEGADPVTSGEQGALRMVETVFGKRGFGVYPQMLAIFRLGGNNIQEGQKRIAEMYNSPDLPNDVKEKLKSVYKDMGNMDGGSKGDLGTGQSIDSTGDQGAESATPEVKPSTQTGQKRIRRGTGGTGQSGSVLDQVQNMFAGINVFFKFDDGTARQVTVSGIDSAVG